MGTEPLISVITVVKNGSATIGETIRSVTGQTYPHLEMIVVDGASDDGTVGILREYGDQLRWISEPDRGIFDAMNKGVRMARGEWLCFLGADDRFATTDVVASVVSKLDRKTPLLHGYVTYADGKLVESKLGLRTLLHNTVHHQGAFYHSSLFKGWSYDDRFRIVADYELNLRFYLRGQQAVGIEQVVARCGAGGVSQTERLLAFREVNAIRKKYLGPVINLFATILFSLEFAVYCLVMPGRK